ncbi:MAG: ethanolamine ammonia-lyase reactivating factor EutA, partial [Pseudomonadota bacterium]|nr:ethanolamine ammonia-lyase reactivating factor EutA [Pseudomonadota bacterium]
IGLEDVIAAGKPLFIVLDGDIAQSLGHILKDELRVPVSVLVIDGVVLWDFDYIDLGKIRLPSRTVPVTIKSLVFSDDPRSGQRLNHEHVDGQEHSLTNDRAHIHSDGQEAHRKHGNHRHN